MFLFLAPQLLKEGPQYKALLGFLVWFLMNFYWLRRPRTLVSNNIFLQHSTNGEAIDQLPNLSLSLSFTHTHIHTHTDIFSAKKKKKKDHITTNLQTITIVMISFASPMAFPNLWSQYIQQSSLFRVRMDGGKNHVVRRNRSNELNNHWENYDH